MSSDIRARLSKGSGSSPFYIEGLSTTSGGGRLIIKQGNLIIELLIEGDKHMYFTKLALARAFGAKFTLEGTNLDKDTKKETSRDTDKPCSTA